jgi:ABC-type cobalamin/Fe3+-siderophores transport system ATPase subunit
MLKSISLKFTELESPLEIPTDDVTIFVGPNNSGKSLVLRELEQSFGSHSNVATKLLDDYEIAWPTVEQLNADIEELTKKAPPGTSPDNIYVGRFKVDGTLDAHSTQKDALLQFVTRQSNKRWVASQFLRFFLLRLDGRTRFALTDNKPRGDLLQRAQNIFVQLFNDDELRRRVRDIVYDAFQVYFTLDQLSPDALRIRLSETEPGPEEQHWSADARAFHGKALHVKEASDGVQAFIGIVCAVLAGDYRALLIDEPEAFLHPPLARKLGYQLTTQLQSGGSFFASTHSADFLIGCLQASDRVRVVRLEFSNGKSKGQIVDSEVLKSFFKTPLLRSANVISALFHDGVVVTESDNDRAFYSEIYYRLAEHEKGYPSILFVNAQNKQTIRNIVGPLRAFGIPAAAAVDIDLLKDGGADWWKVGRLPDTLHAGLGQQRASLKQAFEDEDVDMKKGVSGLSQPVKQAADDFFDQLDRYGIFVVRGGELESWLPHLRIKGRETHWTVAMLERLGSNPADASYVRPESGDVWDYMRKIVAWIKDPARKGTN